MSANTPSSNRTPLNLLSLDGGGIRGLSELVILHEIMERVKMCNGLTELPKPCDYFHLIGGTGTGGLVAIMLGRLRMSTVEALEHYRLLANKVFSKTNRKWNGIFKATTFEDTMKQVVKAASKGYNGEEYMIEGYEDIALGKCVVCALPKYNTRFPRLFRTYPNPTNSSTSEDCAIWQAARATVASPSLFKSVKIQYLGGIVEEFVDAGYKCNNPSVVILEEATEVFGDDRAVGLFLSIGAGHPGVIKLPKADMFQKELLKFLINISEDCEQIVDELKKRFSDIPHIYTRFNVSHGLALDKLEEGQIVTHVKTYLADIVESQKLNQVVESLISGVLPRSSVTLGSMSGHITLRVNNIHKSVVFAPSASKLFTGQLEYIQILETHFGITSGESMISEQKRFLLYGMAGIGKTQICLKFIEKVSDIYSYIYWVDASSTDTMLIGFKTMTEKCSPVLLEENSTLQDLSKSLLNWASSFKTPWLVVFDNADYPNALGDIETCLPHHNQGHILITSRNPLLSRLTSQNTKEVTVMTEADSITLLLHAANISEESTDIFSSAKAIVHKLGFLPLAMDLAGAAIQTNLCSITGYVSLFSKSRNQLLSKSIVKGASYYEQTVYGTFEISFQEIQLRADKGDQAAETALHLLDICACIHHENISINIFEYATLRFADINFEDDLYQYFENVDQYLKLQPQYLILEETGKWDEYKFFTGVQVLTTFSMIKRDDLTLSMHPLIHGYLWDRMSIEKQKNMTLISGAILLNCINFGIRDGDHFFWKGAVPHVIYNMRLLGDTSLSLRYFDDLYSVYGDILSLNGDYEKAIKLRIQVMRARRSKLGEDHCDTLISMASLASTYRDQGRWPEAEALEVQVMSLYKAKLGEDHPDTLRSMTNLASTYWKQGRWPEAEALEAQIIPICKVKLGKNHPVTLRNMANLASIYWRQGRWLEAEALEVQVMPIYKTNLGKDHPDTLRSMANLASIYRDQGRWPEAEVLEVQVMSICKGKLGEDHPDTLRSMANLASTYWNQGRWSDAKTLQMQVMIMYKTKLGENHPDTLISMANLAGTYRNLGLWSEAEALQIQVMTMHKAKLGEDHPDTLMSIANLAVILGDQDKFSEAESLAVEVLNKRKVKLGEEHPHTLISMGNLATTYRGQGRLHEAEALEVQVMTICKANFGEDHPATLKSIVNLASTYFKQGRWSEAEALQTEVLAASKMKLGEDHPNTLAIMNNLAVTYRTQGKFSEAESLGLLVLNKTNARLGEKHPDTIIRMKNLAITYQNLGKEDLAKEIDIKLLGIISD